MDFDFTHQIKARTDEELTSIYLHGKDYQQSYVDAVSREMLARNIPMDDLTSKRNEEYFNDDLQKANGRQGNPLYLFLSFFLALIGGIPAIIAGYIYRQSRQSSIDGQQRYYVYNESTRNLGLAILILGVVVAILSVFLRLLSLL